MSLNYSKAVHCFKVIILLACSHGEVRSIAYKPIEVCFNGTWTGICSNAINASAVGKVLCKQLTGAEKSCKLILHP